MRETQHAEHRHPERRRSFLPIILTILLAPAALLAGEPTRAAALPGGSMALVTDITGASGDPLTVLLNPAAATGIDQPSLTVRAELNASNGGEREPVYTLALLDPGGALAGGLTGTWESTPAGKRLTLGYTIAMEAGWTALGVRGTWTRLPGGKGSGDWGLDAGLSGRLTPWLRLGVSASNVPISNAAPEALSPKAGRAGLTLSLPFAGTFLSGSLLSVGLSDSELSTPEGRVADVGLLLKLGRHLRLRLAHERDPGWVAAGRWGAGVGVALPAFQLDIGYQSDGLYQVGLVSAL